MMAKVSTLAITTYTRSNQIVGKNRKICTPQLVFFIQSTYVKIQKSHIHRKGCGQQIVNASKEPPLFVFRLSLCIKLQERDSFVAALKSEISICVETMTRKTTAPTSANYVNRAVNTKGQGSSCPPPQFLAGQLTLIQLGRQIILTTITTCPPPYRPSYGPGKS